MAEEETVGYSGSPSELPMDDASAAILEMKRDALGHIFPAPKELRDRIKLATHLSGRHPNIYLGFLARCELLITAAVVKAMESETSVDAAVDAVLVELDAEQYMKEHAPSIGGERANQAVKIAQSGQPQERKRGPLGLW